MLIVESKKCLVPVQDTSSIMEVNEIVGLWNELAKVFIPITDILYFVNSSHIIRKNTVYVSDDKIRKHYYLIYNSNRRTKGRSKNKLLIHKGKLSYQLLKYFRIYREEKTKEMELMMRKIIRKDWF